MVPLPDFAGKISKFCREFFPFVIDFACRLNILILGWPPSKPCGKHGVPGVPAFGLPLTRGWSE
jgi:hypothetical protein